jgi:hypothetical protein
LILTVFGFPEFLQAVFYRRGIRRVLERRWLPVLSLLDLLSSSVHHGGQQIGDLLGVLE